MLMMDPPPCSRMIGMACLMDIHADLRLTLRMRSNACSSARCAGPSPPPPIPTLLTRISIRPQRDLASATTAAQSASRETSARNGAALPPSLAIMATVSIAVARSRPTHRTCAPSRANSTAMARPLPMVSPADWPAPTMMAILPCRRPLMSKSLQIGIQHLAFVELNAKTVEHHRDLGVLVRREYHVHALALLEVPRQLRPDRIGDELRAMQIVGRPQQGRIGRAPAGRVGAELDPGDLVIGQAGTTRDRHMLGPFIAGTAEEAGTKDHDLALARRQRALAAQDITAPNEKSLGRRGMVEQRAKDIEDRTARQHRLHDRALFLGPAFGSGGEDARGWQAHMVFF